MRPGRFCVGSESFVGALITSNVKAISHDAPVAPVEPVGPRRTCVVGVNVQRPSTGSSSVMLKVWPPQAVPATPVPTGSSEKTPGSRPAGGQSPNPSFEPQLGVRSISKTSNVSSEYSTDDWFVNTSWAGTFC